MSAEIHNLRMARKRRERARAEEQAQQNRLIHGRSKAEKQTDRLSNDLEARRLDGHKRRRDSDRP